MKINLYIEKYLNILALIFFALAYFSTITFYSSMTFYKEIFAIFGFIFLLLIIIFFKKIYITKFIIFSFIIAIFPIIQYFFGLIYFFQDAMLSSFYIIIFILGIFCGLNYKLNDKNNLLNSFLTMFILVGLLSFFIGVNQYFSWYKSDLLFAATHGSRMSANFGQPNHLSTFLLMSLFSVFYLYQNNKISKKIIFLIVPILMCGIVLTQSRTAWVVCAITSLLYLYYNYEKKDVLNVIFLNIIFMGLVVYLPSLINFFNYTKNTQVITRFDVESSRFSIWPQLLHAILEKPWTGYGWGQVSVAQLSTMTPQSPKGEWFTYSHNLFIDIWVWNGLVLGSVINILILYMLYRCYINLKSKSDLMLFLAFIAFFIHCFLEYPYAYTYFLMPAGLILGYTFCQKNNDKDFIC